MDVFESERHFFFLPSAIVSLSHVIVSCVVGVWLGCFSVVPTTVRESATPDSKENKQADAGIRSFSKALSVRRVVVERFDAHGLLRGGVVGKLRATQQGAAIV